MAYFSEISEIRSIIGRWRRRPWWIISPPFLQSKSVSHLGCSRHLNLRHLFQFIFCVKTNSLAPARLALASLASMTESGSFVVLTRRSRAADRRIHFCRALDGLSRCTTARRTAAYAEHDRLIVVSCKPALNHGPGKTFCAPLEASHDSHHSLIVHHLVSHRCLAPCRPWDGGHTAWRSGQGADHDGSQVDFSDDLIGMLS